jgi:hypothetical protein
LVNEEINVPVTENIIVNTLSDVNACKCLTDIDEVQDQESNIGVCLKNQAETTKSIGLVSARPETEKPVSEADNIKDTDKDEDNMSILRPLSSTFPVSSWPLDSTSTSLKVAALA